MVMTEDTLNIGSITCVGQTSKRGKYVAPRFGSQQLPRTPLFRNTIYSPLYMILKGKLYHLQGNSMVSSLSML